MSTGPRDQHSHHPAYKLGYEAGRMDDEEIYEPRIATLAARITELEAENENWKGKCGGLQDVIDLLRSSGVDESANADKWEWVARHRLTGRELPDTIVRERDGCTIGELLRRYVARAPHPSRSEP